MRKPIKHSVNWFRTKDLGTDIILYSIFIGKYNWLETSDLEYEIGNAIIAEQIKRIYPLELK